MVVRTSAWPSAESIAGSFATGANTLKTTSPYLHFEMTATKDGFFESAIEEPAPGKTLTRTERIDMAEVKAAVEKQTGTPIRYVSGIRRGVVDAFPDGIPSRPAYRVKKTDEGWRVIEMFHAFFA